MVQVLLRQYLITGWVGIDTRRIGHFIGWYNNIIQFFYDTRHRYYLINDYLYYNILYVHSKSKARMPEVA